MNRALVTLARPGWTDKLETLVPGAYVAVLALDEGTGIEGRLAGLELRDTLLVLKAGPTASLVLLFRKPLEEPTVIGQVLKTGTGGINIDACRVSTHESYNRAPASSGFSGISGYALGTGRMSNSSNVGRWPANLVLVHGPGCQNVGTKRIAPITAVRRSGVHSNAGGHQAIGRVQPVFGYGDGDGMETVAAYECQPNCPVKLLDEQSGERPSGGRTGHYGTNLGVFHRDSQVGKAVNACAADTGGASRFYPQFKNNAELLGWVEKLIAPHHPPTEPQ